MLYKYYFHSFNILYPIIFDFVDYMFLSYIFNKCGVNYVEGDLIVVILLISIIFIIYDVKNTELYIFYDNFCT